MLPAGKARLPRERRVAGGIDEAGRGNHHITEPRCQIELANSRAVAGHVAQDRAEENRNAGFLDRLLDPSSESVTLLTLKRAAAAVGRTLIVALE